MTYARIEKLIEAKRLKILKVPKDLLNMFRRYVTSKSSVTPKFKKKNTSKFEKIRPNWEKKKQQNLNKYARI